MKWSIPLACGCILTIKIREHRAMQDKRKETDRGNKQIINRRWHLPWTKTPPGVRYTLIGLRYVISGPRVRVELYSNLDASSVCIEWLVYFVGIGCDVSLSGLLLLFRLFCLLFGASKIISQDHKLWCDVCQIDVFRTSLVVHYVNYVDEANIV